MYLLLTEERKLSCRRRHLVSQPRCTLESPNCEPLFQSPGPTLFESLRWWSLRQAPSSLVSTCRGPIWRILEQEPWSLSYRTGYRDMYDLEIVQLLTKSLRRAIDLPQNFPNQRASLVIPWMIRHRRRASIRMTVQHLASFLPHHDKSKPKQDLLHLLAIHDGNSAHPATSICWSPIKRGRSSPAARYSSRHSCTTSFRLFCNSSTLLPCVCAPRIPGTKPTYSVVSGSHSTYAVNVFVHHLPLRTTSALGSTIADRTRIVERDDFRSAGLEGEEREVLSSEFWVLSVTARRGK